MYYPRITHFLFTAGGDKIMGRTWFLEIGILLAVIIMVALTKTETVDRINPSDIICSTYAQCNVGNVTFNVGDIVSSPKYSFGFKTGEIIVMNVDNKTATIKWTNGKTTTEPLDDLNKVKQVVQ
jgi:hypothetical protein